MIRLILVVFASLEHASFKVPVHFQNGKFLNINHVDSNLKDIELNVNVLTNVYLGRCEHIGEIGCTTPRAEFTDYNVWLEELSARDLIEWTTCL